MSSKKVVLIIEDQLSIAMLLNAKLAEHCEYPILLLKSLAEVEDVLASDYIPIVALCDLTLPDAPHGETVKVLRKHKITTIVLTGRFDNNTRERMLDEMVADYVVKDEPSAIEYVISTVLRLIQNDKRDIWILSSISHNTQKLVCMLNVQRYKVRVFESYSSIIEVLKTAKPDLLVLESIEDIKDLSPIKFIERIRSQYSTNELPMLSCEPSTNVFFGIHLMKYGVNDFFNANFTAEELYVRINQNIERAEAYRQIQRISETDALTGLNNRRYFFEQGNVLLKNFKAKAQPTFMMMCDIDFFKKVNDTYGHQVGDTAIIFVADMVKSLFKDCIVARFGGEEFCIFGSLDNTAALQRAEQLRLLIEKDSAPQTKVHFTLSIGISFQFETLDEGIGFSDTALYAAKSGGRNQVSIYTTN